MESELPEADAAEKSLARTPPNPTGFDRQTLDSIANKRSCHKGDCLSMQLLQGDYLRILDGAGRMPCDYRRSRLVLPACMRAEQAARRSFYYRRSAGG